MKSRPELSEEEIRSFMNFDKLLQERNALLLKTRNRMFRNAAIGIASAILIAGTIYHYSVKPSNTEHVLKVPSGDSSVRSEIIKKQTSPPIEETQQRPVEAKKGKQTSRKAAKTQQTPTVTKETLTEKPADNTYVQPTPVDGYPALYEYFNKELTYPAEAIKDSIQGVVTVIFVIDTQGQPVNIQTENSLGKSFDEEVIRVIRNMPEWRPASYNGKPVSGKISVPLTFKINKANANR